MVAASAVLVLSACGERTTGMGVQDFGPDADADGHVAATPATGAVNRAFGEALPLSDARDLEDARRGFLASDPDLVVRSADNRILWRSSDFDFIRGEAPPSVNPSLWRQEALNNIHGLFEVTDGVYQVRGYDLANMSVIEGEHGRILVDPLTAVENAEAALALVERELGPRPISAVIVTHSHVDHFGGIRAVLESGSTDRGALKIVAPKAFMEESISENVIAGVVMARRADYMFGAPLARSERGHVGSGLGKHPPLGTISIAEPTEVIDRTPQEMTIDGVRFVFQYAPHSEAPAELTFFLPDKRAFCGAEIISRTMHNLYTLRGAKVRDALKWSGYIDSALELFGKETDVVFNSHHWPVWGPENVVEYLEKQRDTYKYIHDQTLHLAALGRTPREIAEEIELPETLRTTFANRGYYGTVAHNAKAVYQHYFGWYDGNPANLDSLPPEEAARRYVDALGGTQSVVEKAQVAYDAGDYRWAAELLNHAVFADPASDAAKGLLAKTYDQLGYRAESGPWRSIYLSGARELRHGKSHRGSIAANTGMLRSVPLDMFFAAMATRIDPAKAAGVDTRLNFVFSDTGQDFVLEVKNSVLHHYERPRDPNADATVTVTREFWQRLLTKQAGILDMLTSDEYGVEGDRLAVIGFFRLLTDPEEGFAIVTP